MIHYHGTPVGGKRDDAIRFLAGRHALVPWRRDEDIGCAAEACQSFCLDNGAFSAWRSGEPISDWRPYYEWAEHWLKRGADWAIVPDVIDGTEADNDHQIACWPLQKWQGVPVFHMHESLEKAERLSYEWPRVAIGSSGEWPDPGTRGWWLRIGEIMPRMCDSDGFPRCKLHGLRMLDPAIFHRLPLHSADSTNAVRNASRKAAQAKCSPLQGATITAERIESHQSVAAWVPLEASRALVFDFGACG